MSSEPESHSVPTVLVTGASSGIGRDIAVRLSTRYRLILNGRDMPRLEETRRACHDPDSHALWCHDLAKVGDIAGSLTIHLGETRWGVTAFVHCAGLFQALPLRSMTLAFVQNVFNVNAFAALEILGVLTRRKVNQKNLGSAVFVSSIASKHGARGLSAYSASKAALDGFMKSLAVELAPDVRLNSVLPGAVRTKMTEEIFADEEMTVRIGRDYPLGIGSPEDVANLVDFLLSDKARWITGQQFAIDGGRSTNITA